MIEGKNGEILIIKIQRGERERESVCVREREREYVMKLYAKRESKVRVHILKTKNLFDKSYILYKFEKIKTIYNKYIN